MGIDQHSKTYRALELYLVMGVAFAAPIFASINALFSTSFTQSQQASGTRAFYGLIYELLALAVMTYVLSRQGRSLKQIGLSFSWIDVLVSILLIVVAYVAFIISYKAIYYGYYFASGRSLIQQNRSPNIIDAGITTGTILFVIINPVYEELIVRAYVISEVRYLTGSGIVGVIVSVVIQTIYHLYQGTLAAFALGVMFLVFSIYYLKFKRIVPVILAHFFFDVLALLLYAYR